MNGQDVLDAMWALILRHLPLRYGKDCLYVSPEAAQFIPHDLKLGTKIDSLLHGVEMRLETRCA